MSTRRSAEMWVPTGKILILLAVLGGLEAGVQRGLLDPVFFSGPTQIATSFLKQLRAGTLLPDFVATLTETLAGFIAGAAAGTAVALLLSRLRLTSRLLEPFFLLLYGLPSIVIAPLFILWFGIGIASKVAIGVYVVFFAVFVAVYTGAQHIDPEFVDALRAMGASGRQVFVKVVVPSCAVSIHAGLKVGIGLALIGATVGEFVAARRGIGYRILFAMGTLDTPALYVGIVLLCLLAYMLNKGVAALGRVLVPWHFYDEK